MSLGMQIVIHIIAIGVIGWVGFIIGAEYAYNAIADEVVDADSTDDAS